ncbi:hypothetical protein H2201_002894 [Coniosporium apollinis]|uniref:Large ribosomal subunit protein mL46 n=1 Tax=Coniosporium apollinis TaxID=61459 RepID=A0ABQ9NXF0_9PEZI|nr:hypothetical protein H2201_002894 [Coniosporium apollinis]
MNAGQKSARQLASRSSWRPQDPICLSCRISRRRHASSAAAAVEQPALLQTIPPATSTSSPPQAYALKAGVVLCRPPQITRDLAPFEKAFFLYQRRLNERLALPFTRYFYFKKDTPADIEWKRKAKTRLTAARDIGIYHAYGKEGWNDEVLVGAKESEPEHQVEALLKDMEVPAAGEASAGAEAGAMVEKREEVERPMSRVTEADRRGDLKSLDRLLQRSLYLVVKNGEGRWTFPCDRLIGREGLHLAAERILVQAGGVNMNTWVVGNAPIGHFHADFPKGVMNEEKNVEEIGEKIFFMKARIMAGQANLEQNKFGLQDFKWLAKEEVEKTVTARYWSAIRNMLADR